ncbi:MAG: class I SAM-dependent methyltransferase [Bacteroidetes bacterium]|nr:MAG: class I SAM-dependent methyltransferase [Bacteroidota bacterium]
MQSELEKIYRGLKPDGTVLDVGCFGFVQAKLAESLGCTTLKHSGVDYCQIDPPMPPGFVFRKADLNREPIPFDDDSFDVVVASHIIEHLTHPIDFFGECARVCKPGGLMYIEAPSERSLWLPSMPFQRDMFFSLSFYDDPTHSTRPWTPQAFHRLSKYYSCEPLKTDYIVSIGHRLLFPFRLLQALITKNGKLLELSCRGAIGWACYVVVRKPLHVFGKPNFNYYVPDERYNKLFT